MQRKEKELQLRHQIIIEAASELFSVKGYNNTTMDEVAEKAELAKATLYKLFPAKEDLYYKVIENVFEQFNLIAENAMKKDNKLKEKLTWFIKDLIEHFIKKSDCFLLLIKEMNMIDIPDLKKNLLLEIHGRLNTILAVELKTGIKNKEIRKIDTDKVAKIFNQMIFGYHLTNLFKEHDDKKRNEAVIFLINLLFEGIGNRG